MSRTDHWTQGDSDVYADDEAGDAIFRDLRDLIVRHAGVDEMSIMHMNLSHPAESVDTVLRFPIGFDLAAPPQGSGWPTRAGMLVAFFATSAKPIEKVVTARVAFDAGASINIGVRNTKGQSSSYRCFGMPGREEERQVFSCREDRALVRWHRLWGPEYRTFEEAFAGFRNAVCSMVFREVILEGLGE